ncbi:hypothetical protein SAMN05216410_1422 [Sanguibacter gelidistatuariae]|uniref:AbiEi antitoxin C-terminal domain-containing protein n=1 Tax=Sanguibacter gelidistatuariae TaxID=1814289 RepID=A0A1G6JWW4_9MICO|nr:hypothetical protein [Sanguibacter gelidistatuariae]SDC22486.1 hypothetical protein SAMN05216410_1422 [Sanguibacter gelidistatuariae]
MAPGRTLHDLLALPPTVRAPFTPQGLRMSATTWATSLRDGDIVEVRPGFAVVPGTPITARLRAWSIAADVPRGVVVGRASAAWVHTGYGPPKRVCVLYSPGGYRPRDMRRLEICQATVRTWERDNFATGDTGTDEAPRTIPVTTVVRTAMDVATWSDHEQSATLLTHLVAAGLDVDEALHRLDLVASWRGAETARTRLLAVRRATGAARQALASAFEPVIR